MGAMQYPRVDDKWGPAGAIGFWENDPEGKPRRAGWLFFGWASS